MEESHQKSSAWKIHITCVFIVVILSLLEAVLGIGDFRGSVAEESIRSVDYRWWLFITNVVSLSPLTERFLDAMKRITGVDKRANALRTLKILILAVPNTGLLIALNRATNFTDFSILARLRHAVFVPQLIIVVTIMLASTFGHSKFYGIDGIESILLSVRRSTLFLLFAFIIRRTVLIVLFVESFGSVLFDVLNVGSECLMALAVAYILYSAAKLANTLLRQMVGLDFRNYYQMHDCYRALAIIIYIVFNILTVLIYGDSLTSLSGYYDLSSETTVTLQIGQAGLVLALGLIDSRCSLRRAEIVEEKLQMRLNMMRYISHEMRNPLNTAFMGLQLLRTDANRLLDHLKGLVSAAPQLPILEGIIETCEVVKEAANVALETLNDMLTFDKMDERKLVVEVEDVDVWRFVSETVRPFTIQAAISGVLLSVDCVDRESRWLEDRRIKADRFKLNQVLRNYVSNALKFTKSPGGQVRVLVEKKVVPHGRVVHCPGTDGYEGGLVTIHEMVRVSVMDNGCGISPENQRKLFGQYVQFDANCLQNGGGSGLGLWISKSECAAAVDGCCHMRVMMGESCRSGGAAWGRGRGAQRRRGLRLHLLLRAASLSEDGFTGRHDTG